MPTVKGEWKVEELPGLDKEGRRSCIVHERILGTNDEGRKFGPMPCFVTESFVRIRRDKVAKAIAKDGGIRLITS